MMIRDLQDVGGIKKLLTLRIITKPWFTCMIISPRTRFVGCCRRHTVNPSEDTIVFKKQNIKTSKVMFAIKTIVD